jgi:2-polyprenyl-6-hydroxyphenyl methylase/3-demethylubiquinone-9 3-methyltransferase
MDYYHDVKDWLGGYPYESIDVGEVDALMTQVGLKRQMVFSQPGQVFGKSIGLFGAGCDEFVYVRPA